jgi:hypothetical protein
MFKRMDWLQLLFLGYEEAEVERTLLAEHRRRAPDAAGRLFETVTLEYPGENNWTGPENRIVAAADLCDPYCDVRKLIRDRLLGRSEPRGAAESWRAFQSFLSATVESTGQGAGPSTTEERDAEFGRGGRASAPPVASPSASADAAPSALFVAPRPPHTDGILKALFPQCVKQKPAMVGSHRARSRKQDAPWRERPCGRPPTNHGTDVLMTDEELRRKLRSINRQLRLAKAAFSSPYGSGHAASRSVDDSSDEEGDDDDDDIYDMGPVEVADEIEWGQRRRHSSLTALPKARVLPPYETPLPHGGTRHRRLKVDLVGGESYIKLLSPEPISPLRAKVARPRRKMLSETTRSARVENRLSQSLPDLGVLRGTLHGGAHHSPLGGTSKTLVLPRVRALGLTGLDAIRMSSNALALALGGASMHIRSAKALGA